MAQKFTLYSVFEAVDKITAPMKKINNSVKSFSDSVNRANRMGSMFSSTLGAIGVSASIAGIIQYGKEIKAVAMQHASLAVAYKSVFGSEATAQMKYAMDTAKQLGLGQMELAQSYMKIGAAAQGTKNAGKDVQAVFLGVSQAASALQMDNDAVSGSLYAIGQMMSKGKVMAEELRGQLGERLPGAFNIAARAMGKTTAQLDKMMQLGNLTAEEFIPKFATQLKKEFGPAAEQASKGFLGIENRFKNLVNTVQGRVGSAMLPAFAKLYEKLTPIVEKIGEWVEKNKEVIGKAFVDGVMGVISVLNTLKDMWASGLIPAILGAVVAIKAVSTAMGILNGLSAMNPWILGIMAVGAAFGFLVSQIGSIDDAIMAISGFWNKAILVPVNLTIDAVFLLMDLLSKLPGLGGLTSGLAALREAQKTMNINMTGVADSYNFTQDFKDRQSANLNPNNSQIAAQHSVSSAAFAAKNSAMSKGVTNSSEVTLNLPNLPSGSKLEQSAPVPGFTLNTGKTTMGWGY